MLTTRAERTVRSWAAAMRADAAHIDPDGSRVATIDRLEPDERARFRRYAASILDAAADEIVTEAGPIRTEDDRAADPVAGEGSDSERGTWSVVA